MDLQKKAEELKKKAEELKTEHKVDKIKVVTIYDGDNPLHCFFKPASRKVYAAALAHLNNDPFKAAEIIFNSCKVEIPAEIQAKDELYTSVVTKCMEFMKQKDTELGEF